MAADLLVIILAVVIGGLVLLVRGAAARVAAAGLLMLAWRYLSGDTWHGRPVTDAGWARPGVKALTPTGHAPRFWYLPRWQRAGRRSGRAAAAVLVAVFWVSYPAWAAAVTAAAAAAAAGWGIWRAWRWYAESKHRRTWAEPLHLVAAPLVGIAPALPAASWLTISEDRSAVTALLPPDYNPDGKQKERLVATFTAKLGIESPEVRWRLAGPAPRLELAASLPPPGRVGLADIRDALDRARPDDLIWGLGKRRAVVKSSLSGDSPHVGLSMGSGAGKSVTARSLVAQMLYRGAIALILDYKFISHMWAEGLPNVAIARRISEIHEALLWLGAEVERRNEVALAGADMDGNVHAVVGRRLIVVGEELNATVARLRAYWREIREKDDPVRSPALEALDAASFMGRQVLTNIIYIGQRLSDKATGGGGDARENIGVIAFARWRASTWKMLAPDFPPPPKSLAPGRLQVVSDEVREAQGILMTAREARELATAGTVSLLPSGMPCAPRVTGRPELAAAGPGQPVVTGTPLVPVTSGPQLVTLKEAVDEGIVNRSLAAVRIARHRGNGFPDPKDQRGLAHVYDPAELAEWDAGAR